MMTETIGAVTLSPVWMSVDILFFFFQLKLLSFKAWGQCLLVSIREEDTWTLTLLLSEDEEGRRGAGWWRASSSNHWSKGRWREESAEWRMEEEMNVLQRRRKMKLLHRTLIFNNTVTVKCFCSSGTKRKVRPLHSAEPIQALSWRRNTGSPHVCCFYGYMWKSVASAISQ